MQRRAGKYTLSYFRVQPAKMILLAAEGLNNDEIAARLDSRREVVGRWRKRFFTDRLQGLEEQARPGRPRTFSPRPPFRLKAGRANCRRPTICAVWLELRSCARGLELDHALLPLIPDRRYQIHDARPIAVRRLGAPQAVSSARSPAAVGVRLDTQHVGGPVDRRFPQLLR